MRWLPFIILACVCIVLQTTLAERLEINRIRPDLVFLLAVHYALHAASPSALIAAWVLGFMVDLCGQGQLGVYAFAYGGMALIVVQLRDSMFRDHPLTSLFVTLVCTWLVHLFVGIHFMLSHPHTQRPVLEMLLHSTYTAMYTAALAPYLHSLLGRLRGILGMAPARRLRPRRLG
jgi:rod shape-determining protein MreD